MSSLETTSGESFLFSWVSDAIVQCNNRLNELLFGINEIFANFQHKSHALVCHFVNTFRHTYGLPEFGCALRIAAQRPMI